MVLISEQAEKWLDWLYQQEIDSDDQSLFVIGYVIPQISLAELEYRGEEADFYAFTAQTIRDAAVNDGLDEEDQQILEKLLTQLGTL